MGKRTASKETLEQSARYSGHPELAAKFIDCAKRALPADVVGSLRRAIEELPGGSAAVIARLATAA